MDFINKYTITLSLINLLWAYLGIKTLLRDYKNKTYIIFSLICLAMIVWGGTAAVAYSFKSYENNLTIMRIAYLGAYFYFPLNLHFCFLISRYKIKTWAIAACYLPALILNICNFLGYLIYSEFSKYQDEMIVILDKGSVSLYFYILSILFYFSFSFLVIYKWGRQTRFNKERIYSRFILILLTVNYIGALIATLILPLFGIYSLQAFGVVFFNLYVGGLYYLITKFRFMNLDYSLMADEIVSNLNDIVILLDPGMRVAQVNSKYEQLFSTDGSILKDKSYYDLVVEKEHLKNGFEELDKSRIKSFTMRITYRNGEEPIITKTYVSKMIDKFGDSAGYFVISSEVKEIKQFQKYFKITNRELEIIELIISGSTYRDVSARLSIAESTVETHLSNIYNKLGINNKIELIRIAGEFNIHPLPQN